MKFICENCKAKYQIGDDKIAGRSVRMKCRRCGHLIQLSASAAQADHAHDLPESSVVETASSASMSLAELLAAKPPDDVLDELPTRAMTLEQRMSAGSASAPSAAAPPPAASPLPAPAPLPRIGATRPAGTAAPRPLGAPGAPGAAGAARPLGAPGAAGAARPLSPPPLPGLSAVRPPAPAAGGAPLGARPPAGTAGAAARPLGATAARPSALPVQAPRAPRPAQPRTPTAPPRPPPPTRRPLSAPAALP
ncbi:MAG: zinc-ribbon domain-containing protein [Polyangiaceae bacterium]